MLTTLHSFRMKLTIVKIFVILALVLEAELSASGRRRKRGVLYFEDESLAIFELTLVTTAGYCSVFDCREYIQLHKFPQWIIDNLRILRGDGSEFPSRSCKKVKFNPPEKVERKLRIMWPSLTSTPSRAIWRKKFRRHGPCVLTYAESREKTFGYFKEAITLYQRSNILKLLEMKAIRPNNRAPVSLDNMILAIDRDNTLVEFNCEGSQNGSDILHGVKLCFDSPTGKRTICPDALRKKTCKTKKVWYLRDIQYLNEYRKIEKQSKNGKLTNPGQSNVRKDDYDEFNNSDEQNDYEYYYDTYEDRSGYTEQDKSPYTDTVVKPQQIAVPKTFKPEHDKLADKKLYPNWPVETKNHPSQYSSCILAMPSALCVFVATSFALVGLREVTLS